MLDWGIRELDDYIEAVSSYHTERFGTVIVEYDWHRNRIVIRITSPVEDLIDEQAAKRWCEMLISRLKSALNIDPDSGLPREEGSWIGDLFSHSGYRNPEQPDELGSELDALVEFLVTVPKSRDPSSDGYLRCRAPLLGTELMFADVDEDGVLD